MTERKGSARIATLAVSVVAFLVVLFFVWNYFAGPLKYRRDINAFADHLVDCAATSHSIYMPISGATLEHAIDGLHGDKCHVRIETLGPHEIQCAFATGDLVGISNAFADLAQDVGVFGGTTLQVSTSNPDPLTEALNSDACETISR